jgi:hypothetical protein
MYRSLRSMNPSVPSPGVHAVGDADEPHARGPKVAEDDAPGVAEVTREPREIIDQDHGERAGPRLRLREQRLELRWRVPPDFASSRYSQATAKPCRWAYSWQRRSWSSMDRASCLSVEYLA